jgi:PAS domain-containing protein
MIRHLSFAQVTFLVGTALLIALLLIVSAYALHKIFKSRRAKLDLRPGRPLDEQALMLAALQGIIARMKEQEKRLSQLVVEAERRAQTTSRVMETLVRELPVGLLIFNREGFLTLSNPAARALLGIDIWSRQRYPEILGPESPLAACIGECLETGKGLKAEILEYRTSRGDILTLETNISAYYAQMPKVEGAICLLGELTQPGTRNP